MQKINSPWVLRRHKPEGKGLTRSIGLVQKRHASFKILFNQSLSYFDIKLIKQAGFSLVELMVVMVIVGLIVGFAVPKMREARLKAQVSSYLADRQMIINAIQAYRLKNNGNDPTPADTSCARIHTALHPYLSKRLQGDFPQTPFGGHWYTYPLGAASYGFVPADAPVKNNTTLHIAAYLTDTKTATDAMRYIPKDGATFQTVWIICHFLTLFTNFLSV